MDPTTPASSSVHLSNCSRRDFISAGATLVAAGALGRTHLDAATAPAADRIIDIHQHVPYSKRTAEQLMAHQKAMGISLTILLPAGSRFGLAAGVNPYPETKALAEKHPDQFRWFANEVSDQPDAIDVMRRQLKAGAIGIGEQKFNVDCDSAAMERVIKLAEEFGVPVLMHFQQGSYNHHIERMPKVLEKFPQVNFIAHAQTWWGHISKEYDEKVLYPTGPVKPGGLTDRLLSDYPNMYGDLSAGSGYRAFIRDEEHARWFFAKHQDKLLYGSDCSDPVGRGPACSGSQQIESVRKFAPDEKARRKIFFENTRRVMKIKV
ncbi:MAG: amidohydrolase family protein [Opitutaceae bacterium]|nr:amidohydrolase family protein [Opitutaceae bacterium]